MDSVVAPEADQLQQVPLDTAASMFALGRTRKRPYRIRLSLRSKNVVDPVKLQEALDQTVSRYPGFFVKLVRRFNHFYFEPVWHNSINKAKNGCFTKLSTGHDCEAMITYAGNWIYFDYFHGVADGAGGLVFLQALFARYLAQVQSSDRYLTACPKVSVAQQVEDAYQKYAIAGRQKVTVKNTFHIEGTPGPQHITTYGLPVATIKQLAGRYGVSVTSFITALLGMAVRELQRLPKQLKKTPQIAVPIDLRKRLSSKTLKNFTLNTSVAFDCAHAWTLASACQHVGQQLQASVDPRLLAQRCGASIQIRKWTKWLPANVCQWVVRQALESPRLNHTLTFSNLGQITWPEALMAEVDDLQMAFSPKPESAYSCAAISKGNQLRLTLVRTIKQPLLEAQITQIFERLGIDYSVSSLLKEVL